MSDRQPQSPRLVVLLRVDDKGVSVDLSSAVLRPPLKASRDDTLVPGEAQRRQHLTMLPPRRQPAPPREERSSLAAVLPDADDVLQAAQRASPRVQGISPRAPRTAMAIAAPVLDDGASETLQGPLSRENPLPSLHAALRSTLLELSARVVDPLTMSESSEDDTAPLAECMARHEDPHRQISKARGIAYAPRVSPAAPASTQADLSLDGTATASASLVARAPARHKLSPLAVDQFPSLEVSPESLEALRQQRVIPIALQLADNQTAALAPLDKTAPREEHALGGVSGFVPEERRADPTNAREPSPASPRAPSFRELKALESLSLQRLRLCVKRGPAEPRPTQRARRPLAQRGGNEASGGALARDNGAPRCQKRSQLLATLSATEPARRRSEPGVPLVHKAPRSPDRLSLPSLASCRQL
ncbi:hypothetical protein P43SY_006529 [Pythium insidiosum]|uniref:Uncharacterized protein n=1 Tax=Pythium insidiosum TaxID=114742 RepID=A0AAD5Q6Y6_PYTIN|nr:hypothetical protein P43SY_006529 [Pythium insidiosum]